MSGLFIQPWKAILAPETNSHMTHRSGNSTPWAQNFKNRTALCRIETVVVWQVTRDVICSIVTGCTVFKKKKKCFSWKQNVCLTTLTGFMYWHNSTNINISNYLKKTDMIGKKLITFWNWHQESNQKWLLLFKHQHPCRAVLQDGSNMTGTDLCVNKPHT
jgi:hypothetical protein